MTIILHNPDQQIDFAVALLQIRDTYLQDALFATVRKVPIKRLDKELTKHVPKGDLSLLASKGLRGEIAFVAPCPLTHNPRREAEKSHQKAKAVGYTECWTVVNVDRIDTGLGARESPSTNRFYRLSQIVAEAGPEYKDFRNRIISLTGIPARKRPSRKRTESGGG